MLRWLTMRHFILAAALAALAAPATAQEMTESYRRIQQEGLAQQRRMLMVMVDSMPERFYRDRAEPGQRDFAGQIEHVGGSLILLVNRFMGAPRPALPDTAVFLNTRHGMRRYVTMVYDWADAVLRDEPAARRAEIITFFGARVPRWKVWDELQAHAWWTGGQLVANFRRHGMAPPGFTHPVVAPVRRGG